MLIFTPFYGGKGAVCQDRAYFGLGRRVGGWEWERGNPGLPDRALVDNVLHVGVCGLFGCVRGDYEISEISFQNMAEIFVHNVV